VERQWEDDERGVEALSDTVPARAEGIRVVGGVDGVFQGAAALLVFKVDGARRHGGVDGARRRGGVDDRGGAAVRLQAAPTPAWLATGRIQRPASAAPCCAPAEFGSACGPARRTAIGGGCSRRLRPSSRSRAVAREACGAYRRRGEAGAVSSASLRAAAVDGECGRSIEDPSAGFSRENRRRKADGTILRPSVKGVRLTGLVVMAGSTELVGAAGSMTEAERR